LKFNKVSSDIIYFECRKPDHLRADCPNLKSQPAKEKSEDKAKYKKGKMKTQKAFWADSVSESSEEEVEEEVTNLCLMANDNLDQSDQYEGFSHKRPSESMWYLNNGYSRHMIRNMKKFILLETITEGKVTLGDDTTRKVIG